MPDRYFAKLQLLPFQQGSHVMFEESVEAVRLIRLIGKVAENNCLGIQSFRQGVSQFRTFLQIGNHKLYFVRVGFLKTGVNTSRCSRVPTGKGTNHFQPQPAGKFSLMVRCYDLCLVQKLLSNPVLELRCQLVEAVFDLP